MITTTTASISKEEILLNKQSINKNVEMAPSHVGARMSLAMLHQQQGKHDEALKALSPGKLFIHFLHSPY
jgi:Tfp pilus assembly protein PilF